MAQRMEDVQRSVVCAICLEVWTRPKTLPCEHIFCEECLEKICTNNGRLIKCPECRNVHLVPPEGLRDSWPTQRVLNNVADGLRNMDFRNPPVPSPRSSCALSSPKPRPPIPPKPSVVIPKSADPLRSFVERHNVKRIQIGEQFTIIVQLCDSSGQVMAAKLGRDNIKAFVDLKPRPRGFRKEEIIPSLTREGKYSVEYQVKRCGTHEVSILLQNRNIQGVPVTIHGVPRGIRGCEIKGPLKGPRDVVEYHGNFLVTDTVSKAVFLIDQAGREIKKLRVPENIQQNFFPMAITVFQNRVFVTDMNNKCVHAYESLDSFPRQFGIPHLQAPIGIAVSSRNGDIFVVDNNLRQILAFNRNLQFLQALYFQSFSSGGKRGGKQHETLQNPHMMTINTNGDKLYVADQCGEGNNFIKVINVSDYTFERKIHVRFFENQARPFGVTLDQDDNIFVSVQINSKNSNSGGILVFNSDGNHLGSIGRFQNQRIVRPFGLLVSSLADIPSIIYVVDPESVKQKDGSLKGFII